ncbi:MAG TPA: UDP-N-acetylmuramoyl-tripeptide--D-alanyl-D-alanine ligase [Ignavibacteria bacterium]|nr:UDP-N-acetylmuramoyl-tripeptide--D-alanyl-D-alanine ligase [Ignavibacteria bacterium]
MKAETLLNIKGSELQGSEKIKFFDFKGFSIDSRKINSSDIFIAIKGEVTDGHKYLKNVFDAGCKLAVINKTQSKLISQFKNKSFITVKDTTKYLGDLAAYHLSNNRIPVLCVAGSNGKTTTKDLIADVLSKRYNVLKTEGNLNNHIGLPLTLLKLNKKHNFCVLEVGSNHFGELDYLMNICKPDYGLVTNIGKEHLEFFKNLNGVAKAEFELYNYLTKNNKTCFYNLDDKFILNYRNKFKSGDNFTYSFTKKSDVRGKFISFDKNFRPEINIKYNGKSSNIKINTFGLHSIFNGLAAASVGLFFDIKVSDIKKSLFNFKPSSSKRMEVKSWKGITIVNDAYNSNPDSVLMGLNSIKKFNTIGKKFIILGDMLELGKSSKSEHSNIGKIISEMKFDNLYTYGSESYNTHTAAKNVKNNHYFTDKTLISELLKKDLRKGDIVYLKGSRGMKMEEILDNLKK